MKTLHYHTAGLLLLLLIFCGVVGCGSSLSSAPAQATPSISSFAANPATITAGSASSLTAVFSNGTGVVTPGNLALTSGTPLSVTPSTTTTYTLTVTNSAGAAVTAATPVTVTAAIAAPSITSFTVSPSTLVAGESSSLTAVFANGKGVITPSNLTATSGTPISVSPTATTTYTLTVTNSVGTAATATTAITVTPSLALAADIGVNIGWVTDWDTTQMFADAMKEARKFGSVSKPYDETASIDAQGWPTQDAGVLIDTYYRDDPNHLASWMDGTYALRFTGQATVQAWGDANVSVGAVTYDSATNTSTASVTVNPAFQQIGMVFTSTKRTAASATGSGITNVELMRPTINGTPHAFGTLFTDRFLARLKYFSALRMMDYSETNSSTDGVWANRIIPADASQQQAPPHASQNIEPKTISGASYEYAIQLANQTGKDLWLNVPHLAFGGSYTFSSTTWVTNLALLLKFGSDSSGNPYTGLPGSTGSNPQPTSGPANPGLNPALHVYIEWSNEFWSGVGNQTAWIQQQAQAAISAKDADLDWDGDTNLNDIERRINAKGVMLIANTFANVYGSGSFGVVYRPVLAGQIAYNPTYSGLNYLNTQHGGANQYVWAIAGAPYADFNGDVAGNTVSAPQIITGMQSYQTTYVAPWIASLASLASTYHLQGNMLAYEGGEGAIHQTLGAVAAQILPGMRGITTGVLNSWFAQGGGTFFYYKLCSGDTWGLAEDISYDIDADSGYSPVAAGSAEIQPKWGAIKQVATLGK